jgi:hypothetical protein
VDLEHELSVIGRHFAGDAAIRAAGAIADELETTGLAVCDEVDFGVIAAAQKAGVPVVVVSVIASGALVRPERLIGPLAHLGHEIGMQAPIRPHGDFYVVPFAPSMRDPRFPAPSGALWMRPDPGSSPRSDGSVVVTLGTEFNSESGDLFTRILSALDAADAPATVAIGRDLDPTQFGLRPPRVRVEQYVDFDAVIPHASVVLHHGGSGLFLRSILGGASQIVFPMGADQPFTADRVRSLGLGQVLDPIAATPAAIAESVAYLSSDRQTRDNVQALRRITLALPEPAAIVAHIEATIAGLDR